MSDTEIEKIIETVINLCHDNITHEEIPYNFESLLREALRHSLAQGREECLNCKTKLVQSYEGYCAQCRDGLNKP